MSIMDTLTQWSDYYSNFSFSPDVPLSSVYAPIIATVSQNIFYNFLYIMFIIS